MLEKITLANMPMEFGKKKKTKKKCQWLCCNLQEHIYTVEQKLQNEQQ